ncbi:MAG: M24 family metallopeptidase, partial [Thermomicrobia bacterium]|nr:M24 family metallopeptidase [Thermomicrobia bacterium]
MTDDLARACRTRRRDLLRDLLGRLDLTGIVLRRPLNFAWYTGGADNRVDHSSPTGVAQILLTPDAEYVVADSIEAPRMREEETPEYEVADYPWFEKPAGLLDRLVDRSRIGSDLPEPGEIDISSELLPLRLVLDEDAIRRYRRVGQDASEAMREVASSLHAGVTEFEAAGRLEEACVRRGMYAPVVMAAGDDRIVRFRHAIPQENVCRRRVMLVICAERGGLYANLTRFVDFEPVSALVGERMALCRTILDRMRDEATLPGRTLADAFEDCRRYYAEAGYPEEWRMHHQG